MPITIPIIAPVGNPVPGEGLVVGVEELEMKRLLEARGQLLKVNQWLLEMS